MTSAAAARARFRSITPLVPTIVGIDEALEFYTTQMAFRVVWRSENMAGIERDGVGLNLVLNETRAWADNASVSIGVSDLDALYGEYRHIAARVGPLETKPWGRREFHVIVPSGVCFQFYEEVSRGP